MNFFLNTDGACRGNPNGISGAGIVIFDKSENEIAYKSIKLPNGTNNQSEYKALILGLNYCLEFGIKMSELTVRLDSNLIVNQLNGVYKVNNPNISALYSEVITFFKNHGRPHSIYHIYREFNKRADELSNNGADGINNEVMII